MNRHLPHNALLALTVLAVTLMAAYNLALRRSGFGVNVRYTVPAVPQEAVSAVSRRAQSSRPQAREAPSPMPEAALPVPQAGAAQPETVPQAGAAQPETVPQAGAAQPETVPQAREVQPETVPQARPEPELPFDPEPAPGPEAEPEPEPEETVLVAFPLELNAATYDELLHIPSVGNTMAQRIIQYREHLGGYTSLNQLLEISGVGEQTFYLITAYLYLENEEEPIDH